ncbi:MAG TPA: tRNA pseudouridine(55) synthase TruB [Candidatus Sulfotelmatobacter sp.]|nr:tRNA pseudouridine(55) synthase TruB [Candidatus Sulfotelmatobacter sp.]
MARRPRGRPLHGWLVLDKDIGLTSADAVARVRRITGAAKAGHGGTLDPLATGVLPIALGEATKTMAYAVDAGKTYRFRVRWGEARATDDAEGEVVESTDRRPAPAEIAAALADFVGSIAQVPPAYSAVKLGGERAYRLARQGEAVTLAPRQVLVQRFDLLGCPDPDTGDFEVDCGKGTYIRALARDLGRRLGCLGHIQALRRTRVGRFTVAGAISLANLADLWQVSPPFEHLLPVETALDDIPALALTGPQADRMRSGQSIRVLDIGLRPAEGTICAMHAGKPVALAEVQGGDVRPVRVFNL